MGRSSTFVSVGVIVGVLMLFTLFATVSTWGTSPRSAEAATAYGVTVNVACRTNPEITFVRNNRNSRITIRSVGSIYQPRDNEPFIIDRRLRPDRAVRFESGAAADMNVLTRQYIYNNDVGRQEGARVRTSVGTIVDRCG
jgi:hypothetical protein